MIEKLNLNRTGVTSSGVLSALDSLPRLNKLDYEGLTQILANRARRLIQTESHQDQSVTTYRLAELYFCDFDGQELSYVRGDLAAVISLCPDLSQVAVIRRAGTIEEQELSVLTRINTLTGLKIVSGPAISFDRSILPILQSNSLESLDILMSGVDIGAIVRFCPRLRHLHLHGVASAFSNPDGPAEPARHLSHLEKMYLSIPNLSADDVLLLLAAPSLVDLTIIHCSSLTDDLLKRAFKLHRFPHLEHLRLCNYKNGTKRGIELFMTDKTPLKSLTIGRGNSQLTAEDIAEWRSRVERCNWQLEIKML